MDNKKEMAGVFSVNINYRGSPASGVLTRYDEESDNIYLFTANHTFGSDSEIDIEELSCRYEIQGEFQQVVFPKRAIVKVSPDYDVVVFMIKIKNNHFLNNLPALGLYGDTPNENQSVVIAGYPDSRRTSSNPELQKDEFHTYDGHYVKLLNSNKAEFEVQTTQELFSCYQDENTLNVGFSGGGIFIVTPDDGLKLLGIETQNREKVLIGVNLTDIYEKELSDLKIKLSYGHLLDELGVPPNHTDLKELKKQLEQDAPSNSWITRYLENQENIENYLAVEENDFSSYAKDIHKKIPILAREHLYRGLLYHKMGSSQKVTEEFEKASKLDSCFIVYFSSILADRDKTRKYKRKLQRLEKENRLTISHSKSYLKSLIKEKNAADYINNLDRLIAICTGNERHKYLMAKADYFFENKSVSEAIGIYTHLLGTEKVPDNSRYYGLATEKLADLLKNKVCPIHSYQVSKRIYKEINRKVDLERVERKLEKYRKNKPVDFRKEQARDFLSQFSLKGLLSSLHGRLGSLPKIKVNIEYQGSPSKQTK